jgi:hypothetical protein
VVEVLPGPVSLLRILRSPVVWPYLSIHRITGIISTKPILVVVDKYSILMSIFLGFVRFIVDIRSSYLALDLVMWVHCTFVMCPR